jgi:hypothetical protein
MEKEEIVELVSAVTELNDASEFLQDEDIDLALATIVRLCAKPNLPPNVAAPLVVQTQALSSKFAMQAKNIILFGDKREDTKTRKNVFFNISAELEKISQALKYLVKQ